MNRTLQSSLAILVVLAGGLASWKLVVAIDAVPAPAPPRAIGPVPVGVLPVEPRALDLEIVAYGNLRARREVTLLAETTGRIVEVLDRWRPGAAVREGEVLVRIDDELYALDVELAAAALAEAEAGVQSARAEERRAERARAKAAETAVVATREHERTIELGELATDAERDLTLRARIVAEQALETSESALEAAQAAMATAVARRTTGAAGLARARETLERTVVRAPFAGRLRGQAPGLGTLATPQTVLGALLDTSRMVLGARVPERDLLLLEPGMRARLSFPATPETSAGTTFGAKLVAIDAASDPATRRGLVEIEFDADELAAVGPPNGDGVEQFLPAGLFTRAVIEVERIDEALWIDRKSFVWRDGEPVAFVLGGSDGETRTVERRVLRFSREHGEGFVVEAGLEVGDRLVVHPLDRMEDGVEVRVLEVSGGPGPSGSRE